MWLHATRNHQLVDADLPASLINFGARLALFSIVMYSIAIIVSFFSTWVSLVLYTITPIPYILGVFYRRMDSIRNASREQALEQAEMTTGIHAESD